MNRGDKRIQKVERSLHPVFEDLRFDRDKPPPLPYLALTLTRTQLSSHRRRVCALKIEKRHRGDRLLNELPRLVFSALRFPRCQRT
jgi:hypothetical protein